MLEQQFRIVVHLELHADLCQQPHTLDVVAVSQQEPADELFGGNDVAVGKQARGGRHLRGQAFQLGDVLGGEFGVAGAPGHVEQDLQGVPACRERRVDVHRLQERLDGGLGILPRDEAVAALLEQPAIPGCNCSRRASVDRASGMRLQIPLADGDDVQDVAILGDLREQ